MSVIIGLMGQKQSGKDTVAARLVERHNFQRVAFADVMRECLYILDPLIAYRLTLRQVVDSYGWDIAKEDFPEVRRLLQVFGTELGRDILGEDVWVNAAHRKVTGALDADKNVVITDMRFPNEVRYVESLDGITVRIDRPGLPDVDTHVSENAWRSIVPDCTINNNGTLDDLYREVDLLAEDLSIPVPAGIY